LAEITHQLRATNMPNYPPQSAAGTLSGTDVISGQDPLGLTRQLPDRYRIQETSSGRVIQCTDVPNLKVSVSRDLSISASAARKAAPGTIFLDGVARCEPFMDHEKQIYNLDHHEGCVRAFTLSACEQALVLSMKGLDLREREWNILANEPDLDTVLAIWILLNHRRIQNREFTNRQRLLTLVRLEGTIDALGLELKELSGLPPELSTAMQRLIDHLRREEIRLKKDALWDDIGFLDYTADLLHRIDRMIYRPSDFSDFQEVKELARADINGKRIVIAVEADMGIYEIEPLLKNIYGDRLGWVVLKRGQNTYTLRQMDIFMPVTLERVYDRLNFIDRAVRYRDQQNQWGGSVEIGGSPRESGTLLTPAEIVTACRDAVQNTGFFRQLARFLGTTALVALIIAAAVAGRYFWPPTAWLSGLHPDHVLAAPAFGMHIGFLLAAIVALVPVAFRRPWQFGLAWPVGKIWWAFLPLAVLGGLAGSSIPFLSLPPVVKPAWGLWLLSLLMAPVAIELLFRSLVHGLLAQSARIGRPKSRLFLSWPLVGAALLFAGYTLWQAPSGISPAHILEHPLSLLPPVLGAFSLGLVFGLVRERSQSIIPPIIFHIIAAGTVLATTHFAF
jgi:membrane protease YdiL (CAAX protease family)